MNKSMNRRRLETMAGLEQALVELLQTRTLKEISVTDICRRANINRSTFYAIHDDMAALALSFCRNVERQAADQLHTTDDFVWLFEYIAANAAVFHAYFKLDIPPTADDYKTLFIRNGVYGIVKRWFDGDCNESAEAMGHLLGQVIE